MFRLRSIVPGLAVLSALAAGCQKEPAPKVEGTPAPPMAPGQASGMSYMKQNGGGQQAPR